MTVPWCNDCAEEKCEWHVLLELEEKYRPRIAELIEAGRKAEGLGQQSLEVA